jgi:phosphinothricin acetyltransferase
MQTGRREAAGGVVGWIALSRVSTRPCYAGVAEVSVYVAGEAWGRGVGTLLLNEAIRTSEAAGVWTLQAAIFPENTRSVRLHSACGFGIVGRRERIAQRDGVWHDTLLMERRSGVVGRESG